MSVPQGQQADTTMSSKRNKYLDHASFSDNSDVDDGYDSEEREVSKSTRAPPERSVKRRKLSHSDENDDEHASGSQETKISRNSHTELLAARDQGIEGASPSDDQNDDEKQEQRTANSLQPQLPHDEVEEYQSGVEDDDEDDGGTSKRRPKHKDGGTKDEKPQRPGVVYLSSLPPYLKPSALRNLLTQRGFHPIKRLFLTPASKSRSGTSKRNSRQLYTEGWIEFSSKTTARRCAATLNAQTVGGKKGGFYHDDLWNMKYLRGMAWEELMAGIREEKREEEGRRDEERRVIARETKRFVEGVEMGKKMQGIKRKKKTKGDDGDAEGEVKRTWRQFEVKGKNTEGSKASRQDKISDQAREVLGQIF